MIDLHIHSTYSDGNYTVNELLQKAQSKKLEVISITDHDEVGAYNELEKLDVKQYFSGKIIPGCEFKCFFEEYRIPIEILGYGIDYRQVEKENNKNRLIEIQDRYLQHLKGVGSRIGLLFDKNLKIGEKGVQYASAVFEVEILKYPENKEILKKNNIILEPNFYRAAQCNKDSIFYIDEQKDFIKVDELIDKIHKAKGLAFLAHPYIYKLDNVEEAVEKLVKRYQIDGIECYYSTFTKEQTEKMINLCKKYNLYISGGSDFHGELKPDIHLGTGKGKLEVHSNCIERWIDKINNIIE